MKMLLTVNIRTYSHPPPGYESQGLEHCYPVRYIVRNTQVIATQLIS